MKQTPHLRFCLQQPQSILVLVVATASFLAGGCQFLPPETAILAQEEQSPDSESKTITTVDVVTAAPESLGTTQEYIGTTQPTTELSLRSQVAGTLTSLAVEVGDQVTKGQVIGQIDDRLLLSVVQQEQSELASLESELTKTKIEVKNAEIKVQEASVRLKQAENDRVRYQNLAQQGLISQQEAESFATAAEVAQKAVLLAEEAVKVAQQDVTSAIGRVAAQKSVIAESRQRQAYTQLIAETTGIVTQKVSEPGNLVQEGEEILKIGTFDPIQVVVLVSELDLDHVGVGQTVAVKLDAFPESNFVGRVKRIAPVANVATRQIPIEIVIANSQTKIKGGLLTRVSFKASDTPQIAIPETAIIQQEGKNYVFVLAETNTQQRKAIVTKRQIQLGDRAKQKVAILQGLQSGEQIVLRSSQPLNDGETVGLSIISE
ncbi:MAG TPA: efflux RND transporter periplasmic adaptor subunit [Xenococcaceae cyanobacterium]